MEHHRSLPGVKPIAIFWLCICLAAGAILWLSVDTKLRSEKKALETQAMKDAVSLSRVYAAYLNRSLEQMDQLTMQIKSDWERSDGTLRLEELKKDGLFTSSEFNMVGVIDRNGRLVTATVAIDGNAQFADTDYFAFHRSNISTALHISQPAFNRLTGGPVVIFSKRLDGPDDAFDGVAVVAVSPAYFLSFYDSSILGNAGLLAVVDNEHALRASTIGGAAYPAARPALQRVASVWQSKPARLIDTPRAFADRQARYVARHELKSYPLSVVVGLSRQELLSPHQSVWDTYRYFAYGATAFLLLVALICGAFSVRLMQREHQALAVRKTYRMATDSANEGFFIFYPVYNDAGALVDWQLADANERAAALLQIGRTQVVGMHLSALYSGQLFQATMDVFGVASACGVYEDEYRVPPDSPIAADWLYRRMVKSDAGLAVTLRDISDAKKSGEQLLRLANEDALTGLPNRHWLMRFLPLALQRTAQQRCMLAVLFIDLDEFKNVNDTLGHSAGDELLKTVAQRVRSVLRPGDKIVRLGGDEFTVIVEQVAGRSAVIHVADRIVQALHTPVELGGARHLVKASIGISVYPENGRDADSLLKNADIAMYSAKAAGKGHYQFFEPHLYDSLTQRLSAEQSLRRAIEEDRFVLHYQPRVEPASGALCGMEALVRWIDPERGMVPPLEFIPMAEANGLILPLGELVIDKACAQVAAWKALGLPTVPVSVNVSARQFNESDVLGQLAVSIARHRIAPRDMQVELTESAMMDQRDDTIARLAAIRHGGFELLMDDFGTGYSSLSQLQRLKMDALKVDRAFTQELDQSEQGQVFFRAIVSMAHALGMSVTAEGVENGRQLDILRALGCDEVQGYFISRPLPASDMQMLLARSVRPAVTSTPAAAIL